MIMQTRFDKTKLVITNGRNVRYDGRALDKFGISRLIHKVSGRPYLLHTDIFWREYSKSYLVSELLRYMSERES